MDGTDPTTVTPEITSNVHSKKLDIRDKLLIARNLTEREILKEGDP